MQMSTQEPGAVEDLLQLLRQDLISEMHQIEQRLDQLTSTGLFGQVERKDILTKAYLLGFARLSLGLNEIDEILDWLNTLNPPHGDQTAKSLQ
jgi:hypothetical protein